MVAKMMRAIALMGCLAFMACGGSGGADGGARGGGGGGGLSFDPDLPGIGGTGRYLTESERIAVINAAKKIQAEATGDNPARDDAMVAHLRRDPTIEAAGVSALGNVWARFIDGTLYMDFSGRDVDFDGVRRLTARPRMLDLPSVRDAVTGNSLEPWWPDSSAAIGGWLDGNHYRVGPLAKKLTHQDLQAFSRVGAFFWQTHSGEADLRALLKDSSGNVVFSDAGVRQHVQAFAYMTSNVLASDGGTALTADEDDLRNRNRLTLATVSLVKGQKSPWEYRLGVTNAFIEERMTSAFAPNSLVAVDSCTGIHGTTSFQKVGVGAFVAWDGLTGNRSQLAHEKLFDRLLGQNAPPASSPLERPFEFEKVKAWMTKKGYDVDRSLLDDGGTNLTPARLVFSTFTDFAVLRPTITRLLFRASSAAHPFKRLVVEGTFGDDPGSTGAVTWGQTPLQIVAWKPTELEVRFPPPPYPKEPLQVKVDQRESQPARLTVWNLPITFTLTGRDTLKAVAIVNCVLRADVRGTRFEPEDAVQLGLVNASYLLDSGGSITASGMATAPAETWAGGASLSPLPIDQGNVPATNFHSCAGSFSGTTKQLTLQVNLNATFTKNASPTAGLINSTVAFPTGLVIETVWSTRTLVGKSVPGAWPIPNETLVVSWPTVAPVAGTAPTDADPR